MQLSKLSAQVAMLLGIGALAAPLADQSPNQSPNLDARQVTLWVWACDSPDFTYGCSSVKTISLNQCYTWSSLFPGIGNGSFKTNCNVLFWDGGGCSGTHSNRVCNVEISRNDYWYTHTQSISIFSTMAACDH